MVSKQPGSDSQPLEIHFNFYVYKLQATSRCWNKTILTFYNARLTIWFSISMSKLSPIVWTKCVQFTFSWREILERMKMLQTMSCHTTKVSALKIIQRWNNKFTVPVTIAECSSPQETCTTGSSRIQNLLAKLSAKRVFPNVKIAPVSEEKKKYRKCLKLSPE